MLSFLPSHRLRQFAAIPVRHPAPIRIVEIAIKHHHPLAMSFGNTLRSLTALVIIIALSGNCTQDTSLSAESLFTLVPARYSGVDFSNNVAYSEELNCYTFRNFYNGGGVGLADFNGDGLVDIFFCANMESNRLYLNRGGFRFEDVTRQAGLATQGVWSSGVSIADVNGDVWPDLFVLKSGPPGGPDRYNELYLNNGPPSENPSTGFVPTFTKSARQYGIADEGLGVHGAFFDYDLDGDLDLYLLNNSLRSVGGYDLIPAQRYTPDPAGGNKLYRNDGTHFTDVTQQAGILSSNIGFGLGVSVGDLNLDGWPDLFVSNDFFERDYLYLNKADGTFAEVLEYCIRETSLGSMGADIADLNNDGWPDIFVTEMLPADDRRIKTKTQFDDWDLYRQKVKAGYYHQFTRNTLQLNLGAADATDQRPLFSEIARLAGVHATDWSWGALAFDMDNDGWRDLFVANGIGKDLTDQDYVNFYSDPDNVRAVLAKEGKAITQMVDNMPSEKLPNYAFRNLTQPGQRIPAFENMAPEWGLNQPGFSNGSAYADLDNDGDLDLVVNNQDMPAFIYRNNSRELLPQNNYLQLELIGTPPNHFAFATKAILQCADKTLFGEVAPMRGFESTVDPRLHFGLGKTALVDTLTVIWPDGSRSVLTSLNANQQLRLSQGDADVPALTSGRNASSLAEGRKEPYFEMQDTLPGFRHVENDFNDFDRDHLIFQMLSAEGPPIAIADVNGDGLSDVFIGGAKDQPGALLIRQGAHFRRTSEAVFAADKISEDSDAVFFDADGDTDMDLYVASGGNELPPSSSGVLDRLYLNDGSGQFSRSEHLPLPYYVSTGCVAAADYDGDGDTDLFVGVRLQPFFYGVPSDAYLLQNDGKGHFEVLPFEVAPGLNQLGMATDALWFDADGDGDMDLAVCGEYMPIQLFFNDSRNDGRFFSHYEVPNSSGWWNCLAAADLNGDGYPDLIAGNHGGNSRFKATPDKPVTMWINDFDHNGTAEQIITVYTGETAHPMVLRNDLVTRLPILKKKYLKFNSYADQTIEDLFAPDLLRDAIRLDAVALLSSAFLNDRKGHFDRQPLPAEAQIAPVYAILPGDFNGDGKTDLLLGGNFSRAKPETGIYNSSYGWVLLNTGDGQFRALWPLESGFVSFGEIRSLAWLDGAVITGLNNDAARIFRLLKR